MLRMEIALFLSIAFVAFIYYSTEKERTPLHNTFSVLLGVVLANLALDGITVYTVNHLETVPLVLNDAVHRLFLASIVLVVYLFYHYIATLVAEQADKPRVLDIPARVFLVFSLLADFLLPITYVETERGNYSFGSYVIAPYAAVLFYLFLCGMLLLINWKKVEQKKKAVISGALMIEFVVCVLQAINPTWLISGMGISLMTLSFYLTLENPAALRTELIEQKMSMLYLKSQVNPHFLYNTLDTIRIQAQLNGDQKVAELLMRLVDFFRRSVKVDRSMVSLDDEMELLEAYTDLICYRYPDLHCEYDIDPDLGGVKVPNFILQPLVENSLLHGIKNKGYKGQVTIAAQAVAGDKMEITIRDTGSGFEPEKKKAIDDMLVHYDRQAPKVTGNSIGLLNVQKRIKLLCGRQYGLSYTENEEGGVTAHILLPLTEDT